MSELPTHHTANGRFRNPPGSPPDIAGPMAYFRFAASKLMQAFAPIIPPRNHCIPEAQARSGFDRTGGQDAVMWLGHAAFLLRMQQKHILLDPFLSERAGPMGIFGPKRFCPPGLSVDQLPRIDFLVLSHGHYDHFDRETLSAIPNREQIDVLAPVGLKPLLQECGYRSIYELDWYENVTFGQLTFTALPAIHFSRRGLLDHNRSLWASFSIASPTQRVFFAGDTAYGKVFDEIGARAGPFDLALVPIGAYAPRILMRPYHAAPEEAVQIGLDIQARHLLAMHWGSISLTTEPAFEPPERFRRAGIDAGLPEERLWVFRVGETRPLPAPGA